MKQLRNFLLSLRGDIFKLLPMKESERDGVDNHTSDYIESLVVIMTGAIITYPVLGARKQYLYVLNNIQYLHDYSVGFKQWRKIILNSTRNVDDLCKLYGGGLDDQ